MKSSAPPQRVPCLDGLRAISVTLVLVFHSIPTLPINPQLQTRLWQNFGYFGHLGVSMFFVISGYIITTLLERERDRSGTISLASFYARRVLRILPALYLYIAVIVLLSALGYISVSHGQIVAALLFLWNHTFLWPHFQGLVGGNIFFGHMWSLCIEEQFYLIWPALLLLVCRRYLSTLAVAWILLAPLGWVFIYFHWPQLRGQSNAILPSGADHIMFGCLCAWWQERQRSRA